MIGLRIRVSALIVALASSGCAFTRIPDLFRHNKQRQEQGYYMGEFEFKMLGAAYLLDRGEYCEASSKLNALHAQLESGEGLIKVPKFASKQEELDFYLELQNPRTGAFMDESYPYCVYEGATGNVLDHLAELARDTGQPLRLKHPLKFFDEIDTPEELRVFLDDVSTVGWLASKLPKTSFHMARNLLSYAAEDSVLEKHGLYAFSPEWKRTLIAWFWEQQDPQTGFWGPRSEDGELAKLDMSNTATILGTFVDEQGRDLFAEFPLRYRDRLFATTLEVMSEPIPPADELDELHEWALVKDKGFRVLLRNLWKDGSEEARQSARKLLEEYVEVLFRRYYVAAEGAFSLYPDAEHATLDGTSGRLALYTNVGAFSRQKQDELWAVSREGVVDSRVVEVARITEADLAPMLGCDGLNSLRLYDPAPPADSYARGVSWVIYPKKTPHLDAADLLPRLRLWLDSTSQSMGNWVSREKLSATVRALEGETAKPVKVITYNFPYDSANETLRTAGEVVVVGFDVLQVPRCQIVFRSRPEGEVLPLSP